MDTLQLGMVTLLKSAITGRKLALPEDFDVVKTYELICKQHVPTLAYLGMRNCGMEQEHPVVQQLFKLYYGQLLRSEKQQRAVNQLFTVLEEAGTDYMPLKGCNMKHLYPKPELRIMGDADVLIRPADHELLRPRLEQLGFRFLQENDHVFAWESAALHLELHKSPVPPEDDDYFAYYGDGWHLAKPSGGHRFDLSREDSFLFLFTHFARHYRISGIGCRHVVDLYVFRQACPGLDEGYIAQELKKLRLDAFYSNTLRLLRVWFEDGEADEITDLMTEHIFSGGSWGSMEHGIYAQQAKEADRVGKVERSSVKAVLEAIFPSRGSLTYRYTVLRKAPWLLPVIWVVRWFDILLLRPQKIRKRVGVLRTVSDDKVAAYRQTLHAVGLDFYAEE